VLIAHGHDVVSSDIGDYQYGESGIDYLRAPPRDIGGIVTNPPFKLASRFAQKALSEVRYVALLLRTNFLEAIRRLPFFRTSPPSRIWISSRRLPMMHRRGWTGPRAGSNTCHAWFIWDRTSPDRRILNWFDWREHAPTKAPAASPARSRSALCDRIPGVAGAGSTGQLVRARPGIFNPGKL
jgi:hypothetical protein